jgi:hypothetical protein
MSADDVKQKKEDEPAFFGCALHKERKRFAHVPDAPRAAQRVDVMLADALAERKKSTDSVPVRRRFRLAKSGRGCNISGSRR